MKDTLFNCDMLKVWAVGGGAGRLFPGVASSSYGENSCHYWKVFAEFELEQGIYSCGDTDILGIAKHLISQLTLT